jgi:hypothetical protein
MMGKRITGLLLLALLVLALAACGGGTGTPDPDFTRLTANVLDANGNPISGLNVRVEGQDTGMVTNGSGQFTLDADDFPNGVNANNEIILGRGGVVLGTEVVVPSEKPDVTIRFNETATGTASVNGTAINEFTGAPLSGVQISLFSVDGGVFQTTSGSGGSFNIANVAAGNWQIVGFLEGFQPEMAVVQLTDGQSLEFSLALNPDGQVRPGDGIKVRGTLTDSKTGAPISGAFISVMADTGYIGIPEPGVWDDVKGEPGSDPSTGVGVVNPDGTVASDGREASMAMPWRYDPQYQETTTAADGTFEFENEVAGYALWFSFSKDGYLAGSHYMSIDGVTTDVDVDVELEPIVPTAISGVVRDENGEPVEGAYVEFIFSGSFGGGPMPLDIAMPPVMDMDDWAADGTAVRGDVGAPPPPPVMGGNASDSDGAGWDDWAEEAPQAGGNAGAPGGGSSGPNFDNQMMQRFRFEQGQNRGASDVAAFDGYFAMTTGPDGTFEFSDVPAGPYYVFAGAYRHETYNAEFTAQEDETQNTINIPLPNIAVGSVEGVVTDENGVPIEDVLVNATQPNVDPFTYTDSTGHFRIDNVPTGTWTISGYKSGYLTVSHDTEISNNGVATVNLQLVTYTPPPANLIPFTGRVFDGTKINDNGQPEAGSGIVGADLVFTPTDNQYGSYAQHVNSDANGNYGVSLINNLDYNLLIQAPDFQDLFIRIWVDSNWPMFDYSLWPVTAGPGGGGGGGVRPPGGGATEPGQVDPGQPEPDFDGPNGGGGDDDAP